jgi:DNA repair protein RadA/Sms
MTKTKHNFTCSQCATIHAQWQGQCADCGAWNSLTEQRQIKTAPRQQRLTGFSGAVESKVVALADVVTQVLPRISCGNKELDRVLGGGLMPGSVVLIGGDPGIGKSTLLLQTLCQLSQSMASLYVTGEESLQQVSARAQRLGLNSQHLRLLAETHVEQIIRLALLEKPVVMVIDSIQTIFTDLVSAAPGSVSQVREAAAQLVQFAKQTNTTIFMVGHVTKEGAIAGPRVLEHMVDTVLYFEGERGERIRMIRAIKNRFGAVNELGVFAMMEQGLKAVTNPSAIFLSRNIKPASGSVVLCVFEGSRPLLVEVQALVTESHAPNPRRVCVGLDPNRLTLLLAALHRHAGIITYDQDVFINVVGGVRVMETAADLAILLACVSSLRGKVLDSSLVVFGEVGLAGEIRPVQSGQERLREAAKHGFKTAIIPKANAPQKPINALTIITVEDICQVVQAIASVLS